MFLTIKRHTEIFFLSHNAQKKSTVSRPSPTRCLLRSPKCVSAHRRTGKGHGGGRVRGMEENTEGYGVPFARAASTFVKDSVSHFPSCILQGLVFQTVAD